MGSHHLKFLRDIFVKKLPMILVVGILCAVIAGVEKYYTSDVRIQTGNAVFLRMLQFEDPDEEKNIYSMFKYDNYMKSPSNIMRFVDVASKPDMVNMDLLDSNWNRMDDVKKYQWLFPKRLSITSLGNNQYEIMLFLDVNTPKDLPVFEQEARKFMDVFLEVTMSGVRATKPNTVVHVISENVVLPNEVVMSKRNMIAKYATIGFFLGCILSTLTVFLLALRKQQ